MTSSSLLATVLLLPFLAHAQALEPFEAVEPHMGTLFRIKLYASDQSQAQRAFHEAFTRVAQLDATLSDYAPDSELNRVTVLAVHRPVPVSLDLFRVLSASKRLSEETDGAFDVTVGPLTRLWRAARKANRVPEPASIEEAKARCGFRKMHLDAANRSVEFDQPDMQLDAGAIAKGDAADQALLVLTRCGIASALVAASGDLAFSAPPPGERGWRIGVDSVDKPEAAFNKVLSLAQAAVSTSGPTEQHLDTGGSRYSHILDPKTGMGLTSSLAVTVITPRGIDADSFATALCVMGKQRSQRFLEQHPEASALFTP